MIAFKIHVFGPLVDITGTNLLTLDIDVRKIMLGNSQAEPFIESQILLHKLIEKFPSLEHKTFVMSVDKKIVSENTILTSSSEIALLPPFSGG